jgi:putative spermidine/putrescine transport system permease protein
LEGIDRTFEEVALSLGASRIRIFFEVTLPLSVPGIAAGIVICFLYNLSGFVTPTLLGGGHFEMVANFVYEQAMQLLNYPFAAAGAFVLLLISLLLVYIINKVSEKMIKGVAKI